LQPVIRTSEKEIKQIKVIIWNNFWNFLITTILLYENHFLGLYYNYLMIKLEIPGRGVLAIEHLVSDVNGTLATDGHLIAGVAERFQIIGDLVQIHLVTANTHGKQSLIDEQLDMQAVILRSGNEAEQKAAYVRQLGAQHVIALGQGANDAGMLKAAAIGIAVLSEEGLAVSALTAADLIMPDILSALDALSKPKRIIASLRK
jgi:soluble P-type ATPase